MSLPCVRVCVDVCECVFVHYQEIKMEAMKARETRGTFWKRYSRLSGSSKGRSSFKVLKAVGQPSQASALGRSVCCSAAIKPQP